MTLDDTLDIIGEAACEGGQVATLGGIVDVTRWLMEQDQTIVQTSHTFANGMYYRRAVLPKGMILTGATTKQVSFINVPYGKVAVWIPNEPMRIVEGPAAFAVPAGVCRLGVVLEEADWTQSFEAGEITNVDEIEDKVYVESSILLDRLAGRTS